MTQKNLSVAHPWHGVSPGEKCPDVVVAYIEVLPTDVVKYEIDKESGLLKIDRPQKFSNQCPLIYGFVPQTYCGKSVAKRCQEVTKKANLVGDGDPLDICVFAERPILRSGILLKAKPIAGLRMIDKDQVDDKILSVLVDDDVYGDWKDLIDIPKTLLDRVKHYFLTYKKSPSDSSSNIVEIAEIYDKNEAKKVIELSLEDYKGLM